MVVVVVVVVLAVVVLVSGGDWLWPVVVGSRNVGSCGGRPRLLLCGDHVVFQNCDLRI